jgi:hypothetical protein
VASEFHTRSMQLPNVHNAHIRVPSQGFFEEEFYHCDDFSLGESGVKNSVFLGFLITKFQKFSNQIARFLY